MSCNMCIFVFKHLLSGKNNPAGLKSDLQFDEISRTSNSICPLFCKGFLCNSVICSQSCGSIPICTTFSPGIFCVFVHSMVQNLAYLERPHVRNHSTRHFSRIDVTFGSSSSSFGQQRLALQVAFAPPLPFPSNISKYLQKAGSCYGLENISECSIKVRHVWEEK